MHILIIFFLFIMIFVITWLSSITIFKKVSNIFKKNNYATVFGIVNVLIINKIFYPKSSEIFWIKNIETGMWLLFISLIINLLIIKVNYNNPEKIEIFPKYYLNNRYFLIYLYFLAGTFEELIFRGFLQNKLNLYMHGNIYIFSYSNIIVSTIFVLIHSINIFSGFENFKKFIKFLPGRIIFSLILGLSFQYTESVIFGIIIHNFTNAVNILCLKNIEK